MTVMRKGFLSRLMDELKLVKLMGLFRKNRTKRKEKLQHRVLLILELISPMAIKMTCFV